MIAAEKISAKDLKAEKYKNELPELYSLKKCVENNGWHNHETVFDHTVTVFENMKKILKENPKIGKVPRKTLLLVSSLLHDVAKPESIVSDRCGNTACPGHERLASEKIGNFSERFGMDSEDAELVRRIVRYHGDMHKAVGATIGIDEGSMENTESLKKTGVYPELLFLGFADTLDGYLKTSNHGEYKKRVEFYRQSIKKL